MSRTSVISSLVAVFLVGISLGILGGLHLARHHGGLGGPFHGGGRPPLAQALPRLQKLLGLTPEQVQRLTPRIDATRREFQAVRDSLHQRIEAELTPDQLAKWQKFQRERGGAARDPDPDHTHPATPGSEGGSK